MQATLVALTARTIADAIRAQAPEAEEVLACGGGANNTTLMQALAAELKPRRVATTATARRAGRARRGAGVRVARARGARGTSGNLPAVTGAKGPARAGCNLPALKARARRSYTTTGPQGPVRSLRRARGERQTEKLDPQPQVVVAFGFLITNCAPSRPSW